ncbi:MAG: transglutaminase family protein [Bryobacterales bacterium]|nr:transglutaminase family protein [Bryobacterales bacterium]
MIVTAQHSTVYRYPFAVQLEPHTFRLRPRMTTTQRLLAFQLQVLPAPAGQTECLDQDGNLSVRAWFSMPTYELNVRSEFTVELIRENPFDFLIRDESLHLSLWYPDPLSTALAPYRNDGHVAESVRTYAASVAANAQWNTLSFLLGLCRQIFSNFQQMTRPEGPPWTSGETLWRASGSCRDLAILFCDCCRVMGIAARFVSGYECASAGRSDAYMHAWAEVYLPNAGWRGYDPSRGVVVADAHVAVAAAFDSVLASPVIGSYHGGSGSRMETSLHLQVEAAGMRGMA